MGCGCGGSKAGTAVTTPQVYIYTSGVTGRQTTFNSKYEADYAKMRDGGNGSIRVEAKP